MPNGSSHPRILLSRVLAMIAASLVISVGRHLPLFWSLPLLIDHAVIFQITALSLPVLC